MGFPAVPPLLANPKLQDAAVQAIQQDFQNDVTIQTWLTKAFARTVIGIAIDDEKGEYPQLYKNDGSKTHFDLRPDDKINCFCFFEVFDYTVDRENDEINVDMAVVFWGRLKKMIPAKAYDYSAELQGNVLDRLIALNCRSIVTQTNPEDVFARYSGLKQLTNQPLMKPLTGWRHTFTYDGYLCT